MPLSSHGRRWVARRLPDCRPMRLPAYPGPPGFRRCPPVNENHSCPDMHGIEQSASLQRFVVPFHSVRFIPFHSIPLFLHSISISPFVHSIYSVSFHSFVLHFDSLRVVSPFYAQSAVIAAISRIARTPGDYSTGDGFRSNLLFSGTFAMSPSQTSAGAARDVSVPKLQFHYRQSYAGSADTRRRNRFRGPLQCRKEVKLNQYALANQGSIWL